VTTICTISSSKMLDAELLARESIFQVDARLTSKSL